MNRFLTAGASALVATSMAAGGLLLAGPASASAGHRAAVQPAATSTCTTTRHRHPFPGGPARYAAGAAGTVTVAPVNRQTIKVTKVAPARGYKYFIDTAKGSSVDVYFHNPTWKVKFEAEVNDLGGLTVKVTTCPR